MDSFPPLAAARASIVLDRSRQKFACKIKGGLL
jgi:hypothetical protein